MNIPGKFIFKWKVLDHESWGMIFVWCLSLIIRVPRWWFHNGFKFCSILPRSVGKISQLASAYNLLFVYFSPNAVKSPPQKKLMGSGNLRSLRDLEKIVVKKIPAAVRSKFPHSKFTFWPFFCWRRSTRWLQMVQMDGFNKPVCLSRDLRYGIATMYIYMMVNLIRFIRHI